MGISTGPVRRGSSFDLAEGFDPYENRPKEMRYDERKEQAKKQARRRKKTTTNTGAK